eukprot:gene34287-29555_t
MCPATMKGGSGDTGGDAFKATPHTKPDGQMMASVIVELVKEFYPWARWVPLGHDPNEEYGDGLQRFLPLEVLLRHWGPKDAGHFVSALEDPPGEFWEKCSLKGTARKLSDWERYVGDRK